MNAAYDSHATFPALGRLRAYALLALSAVLLALCIPAVASAASVDDAYKYAIQDIRGYGLMTGPDKPSYALADGENGWGWDAQNGILTLRNYDDRARLSLTDPVGDRLKPGFSIWNASGLDTVTIKFEGTNYINANAGSEGCMPIQFDGNIPHVVFEGAPGATLNLDSWPMPSNSNSGAKIRADLFGIYFVFEAQNSTVEFTGGTVNLTGHFSDAELAQPQQGPVCYYAFSGPEDPISFVRVSGSANLHAAVEAKSFAGIDITPFHKVANVEDASSGDISFQAAQEKRLALSPGAVTLKSDGVGTFKVDYLNSTDADQKAFSAFNAQAFQTDLDAQRYTGLVAPTNMSMLLSKSGKPLFPGWVAADGTTAVQAIAAGDTLALEVGRVYSVDVLVNNKDNLTLEGAASALYDGKPLAHAFGTETPAASANMPVTVTAPKPPKGYKCVWRVFDPSAPARAMMAAAPAAVGAPAADEQGKARDVTPEEQAAMGITADDLSSAGFTYKQPAQNIVWQVSYVKNTYTVTLDPNGGTLDPANTASFTVDEGATLDGVVKAPTKDGCKFVGWTLDGVAYDLAKPVMGDITLKAVFEPVAELDTTAKPKGKMTPQTSDANTTGALVLGIAGLFGLGGMLAGRRRIER